MSDALNPMQFRKTELPQGPRIVTENHPNSQSFSIGIWVKTGTRHEPVGQEGITHFLEHLVFKGTTKRTAFQIAKSLEEVGGEINAFTTREYTCFHALVLKRYWKRALDVLSDLVTDMECSKGDFDRERQVVLQEIAMAEDEHEELAYDLFLNKFVGGKHPLGREILGTEKSLGALTQKSVGEYYRTRYAGSNLVISAAGAVDHDELVIECKKKFKAKLAASKNALAKIQPETAAKAHRFVEALDKPSEQLHLLIGFPASSFRSPKRFESFFVNAVLGGGMTSQLFQEIREKKGLAYTVYSQLHSFVDFGMLNIAASMTPETYQEVVKVTFKILTKLKKNGISKNEMQAALRQIEGSLILGSEDIENRMNSLGVNEMIFGQYRPVEKVIEDMGRVTVASIKEYLDKTLDLDKMGVLFLGAKAESAKLWFEGEFLCHHKI
jgi:predicted Zn-dependent peptidase